MVPQVDKYVNCDSGNLLINNRRCHVDVAYFQCFLSVCLYLGTADVDKHHFLMELVRNLSLSHDSLHVDNNFKFFLNCPK